MIRLTAHTEGLVEMLAKLDRLKERLPEVGERSIDSALQLGYDVAFALCPIGETGLLQKSIYTLVTSRHEGIFGDSAPYAYYVNFVHQG